ncbi:MAG: response regulator [Desulfomonilia bacterium]
MAIHLRPSFQLCRGSLHTPQGLAEPEHRHVPPPVPGPHSQGFEVYLPEIESEKIESGPSEKELYPTGTERILFVDDELILVELAEKMFNKLGYTVVTKSSSSEALELFQKDPDKYDLVITDLTMPVMTGDRVAQRIMESRPDIPIILCSRYSENISEEKAKKIGIREFVMKPLEMKTLAKAIRKALDGG